MSDTTRCQEASTHNLQELLVLFGEHAMFLERKVHELATALTAEDPEPYRQESWEHVHFEGGWMIAMARERKWYVVNPMSGFEDIVDSRLLSMACWIKALSAFAMAMYQRLDRGDQRLDELKHLFCLVQEYAAASLEEDERSLLIEMLD